VLSKELESEIESLGRQEKKEMKIAFGKQIAVARTRYGISQTNISKLIGRSQWWLSAVERGKIPISEPVANKILLAVHRVGQRVQAMAMPASELKDLQLDPRSNATNFTNLKYSKGNSALR
jgi:hypothetical protein